jgi:hypothetical protein
MPGQSLSKPEQGLSILSTIIWESTWPSAYLATVSWPNFARESASAPFQVPAGADFRSLLAKSLCSSNSASQVRMSHKMRNVALRALGAVSVRHHLNLSNYPNRVSSFQQA